MSAELLVSATGRVGHGARWRLTGRELRLRLLCRGSYPHGDVLDALAAGTARNDHGRTERDTDAGEHVATVELGEREIVRRGRERGKAERFLRRERRDVEPRRNGCRRLDSPEHGWRHQRWRPSGALGGRLGPVCFRQSGHAAVHDSAFVWVQWSVAVTVNALTTQSNGLTTLGGQEFVNRCRTGRARRPRLWFETCPDARS